MTNKVENLLAALRGEASPEPASETQSAEAEAAEGQLSPLRDKISELEKRLEELAAAKPQDAGQAAEEALPQAAPPQPPTEIALYLQTRMELLEKKLELAQHEALRSNLLLREREEAQRNAQKEVEDLFRGIRESQRAASWDRALREGYSSAQARIKDLQIRLNMAEMRMVPAEEVLRRLQSEEGRAELEKRLRGQLEGSSSEPPAPPGPEVVGAAPQPKGEAAFADPPPGLETLAAVMGRVADLEHRLQESEGLREKERQDRLLWEKDMLLALRQTRSQWQKAGGPDLLVEAALESMVDSLRERDEIEKEMSAAVAALQDEPPGSGRIAQFRAHLADRQQRMLEIQERIDKQMALVQAWVERSKGSEKTP
jgi:hypothetical protein